MAQLLFFFLMLTSPLTAANIGLLIMATGKYIHFVPPLVQSARKHFCTEHNVTYYIFTDGTLDPAEDLVVLPQQRLGWPFDTMKRYHAYLKYEDILQHEDYLFATDADMLFVDTVGSEILGERVATIHPGFVAKKRNSYSYETRHTSTAYVKKNEGHYYFAGGFYGGTSSEFITIAKTNARNIDTDLRKNVIAVWHDESHWNRYCIDHMPTVILSPSYCFPEGSQMKFKPRLIALNKNHKEMRSQ